MEINCRRKLQMGQYSAWFYTRSHFYGRLEKKNTPLNYPHRVQEMLRWFFFFNKQQNHSHLEAYNEPFTLTMIQFTSNLYFKSHFHLSLYEHNLAILQVKDQCDVLSKTTGNMKMTFWVGKIKICLFNLGLWKIQSLEFIHSKNY